MIKEIGNEMKSFVNDLKKNISNKEELKKVLERTESLFDEIFKELNKYVDEEEKKLKEIIEKNRQENEKLRQNFEKNLNNISQENNNLKRIIEEMRRPPAPPPQPQVNYFRATPYTGVSIVDGLAAIGEPRSYDYRAQIASVNGIGGYSGTPEQNTHMLNLLKQGMLIKP